MISGREGTYFLLNMTPDLNFIEFKEKATVIYNSNIHMVFQWNWQFSLVERV